MGCRTRSSSRPALVHDARVICSLAGSYGNEHWLRPSQMERVARRSCPNRKSVAAQAAHTGTGPENAKPSRLAMINCASGVTISRLKMQRRRLGSQPSLTVADEKAASFRAGILSAGRRRKTDSASRQRPASVCFGLTLHHSFRPSQLIAFALVKPCATRWSINSFSLVLLQRSAHIQLGWVIGGFATS